MKTLISITLCLLAFTTLALAEGVNGKFVSERKMERDGQSMTITQTFDLKSDGTKLKGTLTMAFGDMEPRTMEITDGKVDGNKVSFATVFQGPNGDMKMTYKASLEGDTLKGTSSREGGDDRPFEAKKK